MLIRHFSLLVLACLALTSCLEVKFLSKVERNGAGEMTITTETPARNPLNQDDPLPTAADLKAEADAALAQETERAKLSGVEITDNRVVLEGDKKVQSVTLKFDNLKELNSYFSMDPQSKAEVSLTTKGENTTLRHKISPPVLEKMDAQQQAMMNAVLEKARMTISWRLPAEAGVISEGGVVSDDGRTVNWELPLKILVEEGVDVFASFEGTIEETAEKESEVATIVSEASEPEQVGHFISLFNVMLFLSIFGAVMIAFLVFLKIKVSRMEKK